MRTRISFFCVLLVAAAPASQPATKPAKVYRSAQEIFDAIPASQRPPKAKDPKEKSETKKWAGLSGQLAQKWIAENIPGSDVNVAARFLSANLVPDDGKQGQVKHVRVLCESAFKADGTESRCSCVLDCPTEQAEKLAKFEKGKPVRVTVAWSRRASQRASLKMNLRRRSGWTLNRLSLSQTEQGTATVTICLRPPVEIHDHERG